MSKTIADLENQFRELSSHNAKKNRQANKLQSELDELGSKKVQIERALEDKNQNLKNQLESKKSKISSALDLIKEKK